MEDGDYTLHVTFNDDVMGENIKFLTMCMLSLGRTDVLNAITRAMECMRGLQQPAPQAGWSLQHLSRTTMGRPGGSPAGARSYEPRSLATHTTQTNLLQLFNYFTYGAACSEVEIDCLTGDHVVSDRMCCCSSQ